MRPDGTADDRSADMLRIVARAVRSASDRTRQRPAADIASGRVKQKVKM
jgi:hypothetical protein